MSLPKALKTSAQLHFLINCGCQLGQGYYFSKPVLSEDLMGLLAKEQAKQEPFVLKHIEAIMTKKHMV